MDIVNIEDINVKYAELPKGNYLIDGEVVLIDSYYNTKVKVKDIDNIRYIRDNIIVTKYIKDDKEMSIEEYETKKQDLLKHRIYDEYDDYKWDDLESEYEYKKSITYWKPVYKTVQEISEPIKVKEIKTITYDTQNKFIKNAFLNGSDDEVDLYIYNRPSARKSIVYNIFKELGFEFKGNISYMATENKKVWGNSEHSVIRYVTAFGRYIFDDTWDSKYTPRGTLEDMKKLYNEDYEKIRGIIIKHYNKMFGKVDEGSFDFVKLLDELYTLRNNINNIDSKVKTQDYKNRASRKVSNIIDSIEKSFK